MVILRMNVVPRILNSIKIHNPSMLVFDMAGTTVNEGGIVYDTLYDTIKAANLDIRRDEIDNWHGANKNVVLDYFYCRTHNNLTLENKKLGRVKLREQFDKNLKSRYFDESNIKLMDENIPELFNKIRSNKIKIALNTGYNRDIQKSIVKKLNMDEFVDDYISSEDVSHGRPYPYMINRLMERNGVDDPGKIIKFGDSKNDILEGINARTGNSIGVLTGADTMDDLIASGANHVINSVMDIDI